VLYLIEGELASENFPVPVKRRKIGKIKRGPNHSKKLPPAVVEPDCQSLRQGIELEKLPVELKNSVQSQGSAIEGVQRCTVLVSNEGDGKS
jgi:hypothetical protein